MTDSNYIKRGNNTENCVHTGQRYRMFQSTCCIYLLCLLGYSNNLMMLKGKVNMKLHQTILQIVWMMLKYVRIL